MLLENNSAELKKAISSCTIGKGQHRHGRKYGTPGLVRQFHQRECRSQEARKVLESKPSEGSNASSIANRSRISSSCVSHNHFTCPYLRGELRRKTWETQRKRIFLFVIPSCQHFYGRLTAARIQSPPNEKQGFIQEKQTLQTRGIRSFIPYSKKDLLVYSNYQGTSSCIFQFPLSNSSFLTFIILNDVSWIPYELSEISYELMISHISSSCISGSYFTIQHCSHQSSSDSSHRF